MSTKAKIRSIIALSVLGVIVALIVGSCTWVRKSAVKTFNANISKAPFDAIIVPGIPYDTALSGSGAILLKSRMLWSKHLFENGLAKNIIYSGSAVHTPYHEGMVMKMIAESWGIPSENTFVEGNALHSTENVIYGLRLAKELGFKNVAVATDPFQSLFLKRFVYRKKLNVSMLPLSVDSMPVYNSIELPKIEVSQVFVEDFVPLKNRKKERGI